MSKCNLCDWICPEDELEPLRKQRHELFHSKARIQKRNTTQGIVEWIG